MSLAEDTRQAVRDQPFLFTAIRAGVVNYTAAARFLDIDGEIDAVATALRRYAEELPALEHHSRDVRVRMQSGIGPINRESEPLLALGPTTLGANGGDRTAILATGDVDATVLQTMLAALDIAAIGVGAAGVADGTAVLVVERRAGANAVRVVERALESR